MSSDAGLLLEQDFRKLLHDKFQAPYEEDQLDGSKFKKHQYDFELLLTAIQKGLAKKQPPLTSSEEEVLWLQNPPPKGWSNAKKETWASYLKAFYKALKKSTKGVEALNLPVIKPKLKEAMYDLLISLLKGTDDKAAYEVAEYKRRWELAEKKQDDKVRYWEDLDPFQQYQPSQQANPTISTPASTPDPKESVRKLLPNPVVSSQMRPSIGQMSDPTTSGRLRRLVEDEMTDSDDESVRSELLTEDESYYDDDDFQDLMSDSSNVDDVQRIPSFISTNKQPYADRSQDPPISKEPGFLRRTGTLISDTLSSIPYFTAASSPADQSKPSSNSWTLFGQSANQQTQPNCRSLTEESTNAIKRKIEEITQDDKNVSQEIAKNAKKGVELSNRCVAQEHWRQDSKQCAQEMSKNAIETIKAMRQHINLYREGLARIDVLLTTFTQRASAIQGTTLANQAEIENLVQQLKDATDKNQQSQNTITALQKALEERKQTAGSQEDIAKFFVDELQKIMNVLQTPS